MPIATRRLVLSLLLAAPADELVTGLFDGLALDYRSLRFMIGFSI